MSVDLIFAKIIGSGRTDEQVQQYLLFIIHIGRKICGNESKIVV